MPFDAPLKPIAQGILLRSAILSKRVKRARRRMKRTPLFILGILLTSLLLAFAAIAQNEDAQPNPQELKQRFDAALVDSLKHLTDLLKNPKYRVRQVNESLQKTAQAIETLTQNQNYAEAESLLREAVKLNSENILSILLLADALESQQKTAEANETYTLFLKKVPSRSSLSKDLMSWESRIAFAEYAKFKLLSRALPVPNTEGLLKPPLIERIKTEKNSLLLNVISIGLPLAVLISTFFIIFWHVVTDGDFDNPLIYQFIMRIYFVLIAGYATWLLHLFVQIPPFMHPEEEEILVIILLGVLTVIGFQIKNVSDKQREKLSDPSKEPCPFCKKIIDKLSAFCPFCRHDL